MNVGQAVEDVLAFLVSVVEQFIDVTEPTMVVLLNVAVLAVVVVIVMNRVRAEMRGVEWSRKTPEERARVIYDILVDAWHTAEWLYSWVETQSEVKKREVAEQKRKAAIAYAQKELRAAGASLADLSTVDTRIEKVAADMKAGYRRYSRRLMSPVESAR